MGRRRALALLDEEDYRWLVDQVRAGRFSSVSHGLRYALKKLREVEEVE